MLALTNKRLFEAAKVCSSTNSSNCLIVGIIIIIIISII